MTPTQIVEILGREQRVEEIIKAIFREGHLSQDHKDLAQMVYVTLLTYDPDKIRDLWEHDEINFFIVRIIRNQTGHNYTRFNKDTHLFKNHTIDITTIEL